MPGEPVAAAEAGDSVTADDGAMTFRVPDREHALAGELPGEPVPVILTCGVVEENNGNNRLMLRTLRARGYQATRHEVPDMHNYTAWRDAFDPGLTALLGQVSG